MLKTAYPVSVRLRTRSTHDDFLVTPRSSHRIRCRRAGSRTARHKFRRTWDDARGGADHRRSLGPAGEVAGSAARPGLQSRRRALQDEARGARGDSARVPGRHGPFRGVVVSRQRLCGPGPRHGHRVLQLLGADPELVRQAEDDGRGVRTAGHRPDRRPRPAGRRPPGRRPSRCPGLQRVPGAVRQLVQLADRRSPGAAGHLPHTRRPPLRRTPVGGRQGHRPLRARLLRGAVHRDQHRCQPDRPLPGSGSAGRPRRHGGEVGSRQGRRLTGLPVRHIRRRSVRGRFPGSAHLGSVHRFVRRCAHRRTGQTVRAARRLRLGHHRPAAADLPGFRGTRLCALPPRRAHDGRRLGPGDQPRTRRR